MRYGIITGTGRSGTNWLLDTLDSSPETHCRNEPHGVPGTLLNEFPRVWNRFGPGSEIDYVTRWDHVAATTARRFGRADHHFRYPKSYFHPWTNQLNLSRSMTSPRMRAWTSRLDRRLAAPEWEMPRWLGSQRRLVEGFGVLKILIDAPLTSWILRERTEVPLLHIIRHPGGRLNSWLTRLIKPMTGPQRDALRAERSARLDRIRHFDQTWATILPAPEELSLIEIEMWLWRYVNESTMNAGAGFDRYRLVRFDDLAADPVGQSRLAFQHMGLTWNTVTEERIMADSSRSVFGSVTDSVAVASAWRSTLDPDSVRTIDNVMSGSVLGPLLEAGQ